MTSCFPSSFTFLEITTVFSACVGAFQNMILTTQNSTQLIHGTKTSFRPRLKARPTDSARLSLPLVLV